MRSRPRSHVFMFLSLLLTASTSGCLRDDIFPEPYAWKSGTSVTGQGDAVRSVDVPPDAHRLRVHYVAELGSVSTVPVAGERAGTQLRLRGPDGDVRSYNMTRSGTTADTFAGAVGGPWGLTVSDPSGQARYDVRFDWYVPKHDGWAWWKVWQR